MTSDFSEHRIHRIQRLLKEKNSPMTLVVLVVRESVFDGAIRELLVQVG